MKFLDIKDIRQKSRSILNNISIGEKASNHDEKFLIDLLKYHPNKEKGNDLDYITSGLNEKYNNTLCFFIIKKDGSKIDFSINKCLNTIIDEFGIKK